MLAVGRDSAFRATVDTVAPVKARRREGLKTPRYASRSESRV